MIASINGQMLHVCAALLPEIETMREQVLKESMHDAMMVRTSISIWPHGKHREIKGIPGCLQYLPAL